MIPLGNDLQRVPENQTSKINSGEGAGFPQQSARTSNKPRVDEPRLRNTTTALSGSNLGYMKTVATRQAC